MGYRYRLEKYKGTKTRYACPACGCRHEFTRYVDTQTGAYLADNVGRCNRELNCGHHYTPKQYFADHCLAVPKKKRQRPQALKKQEQTSKPLGIIPFEMFRQSLSGYSENA